MIAGYVGYFFRMDPVAALSGGEVAIAVRLAAADHVAETIRPGSTSAGRSDGMPEA